MRLTSSPPISCWSSCWSNIRSPVAYMSTGLYHMVMNPHFASRRSERPMKKALLCAAICLSSLYLQTCWMSTLSVGRYTISDRCFCSHSCLFSAVTGISEPPGTRSICLWTPNSSQDVNITVSVSAGRHPPSMVVENVSAISSGLGSFFKTTRVLSTCGSVLGTSTLTNKALVEIFV